MKHFSFILISTLLFCLSGFSQGTYPGRPQFGTAPNQNQTGATLTYAKANIADTAGATPDTITIIPASYDKTYVLTLTDSCVVAIKNTSTSWSYSTLNLIIQNTSGSNHWVKLLGYSGLATQWVLASAQSTKISPNSGKRCFISFICDGTAWVQKTTLITQ